VTCDVTTAGKFYNAVRGACQLCEPGLYSLGGGYRLDEWKRCAVPCMPRWATMPAWATMSHSALRIDTVSL